MTRRCTFCGLDAPTVDAKDATICLSCAQLAVEALSPPAVPTWGFAVVCDLSKIMRVRCPDDGKAGSTHLAVDVRLPLSLSATGAVLTALSRCSCGAAMVIRYDDTPPIGGAS